MFIALTLSAIDFTTIRNEETLLQNFLVEIEGCDLKSSDEVVVMDHQLFTKSQYFVNGYTFKILSKEELFFYQSEDYWTIQIVKNKPQRLITEWFYTGEVEKTKCKTLSVVVNS